LLLFLAKWASERAWTAILVAVAWVFHDMLDRMGGPAHAFTAGEILKLQTLNRNMYHIVLWGSLASIVLSFAFWLSLSHSVFGPMVQIHRHIKKLKDGELDQQIRLRSNDEFHNVAESLNELTDKLKASGS
jgi:methyl-accepting chemotaxis protein